MAAVTSPQPSRSDELSYLINVQEVARLLSMSTRSVWRKNSKGTMPKPVKLAGTKWIRREISEWVDDGCPSLKNDRLQYRRTRASLRHIKRGDEEFTMAAGTSPPSRPSDEFSHLIDAEEVARLLSMSSRSVWRQDSNGTMPEPVEMAGTKWIRREIQEWVGDGCPSLKNDRLRYRRKRAS